MGSPFNLIIFSSDSVRASRIAKASFQLVDSLVHIFSDYIPNSELNLLSATAGADSFITVSPALFEILSLSKNASKVTRGRFDVTISPLSRLWRKARREKKFPQPDSVRIAKEKVSWKNMIIDKDTRSIKLLQKNMQLDLGGIAAGYVARQVAQFLKTEGVTSALIDASGDIVCTNAPPAKKGWTIGINQAGDANRLLEKNIEIDNCSVSTSGDVYQYLEHNGKKYSHIINPKTGYGGTFQRNVTIIAKEGATADWLATACSIMPLSKVRRISKKMKAEFFISQLKKAKIKQYSSRGFRNYWQKTN